MTITYEKLLELYFQNPQFGYYFVVLISQQLRTSRDWKDCRTRKKAAQQTLATEDIA